MNSENEYFIKPNACKFVLIINKFNKMLRDIRKQYEFSALNENEAQNSPYEQFNIWLKEAIASDESEPTAMILSTIDHNLQPHSRVVLLKELKENGFIFYTNYQGNKALQIEFQAKVSLLFFWQHLERQVRITGKAEKISELDSTSYFRSRPLDSQLGAWASPQSQIITHHDVLDKRFENFKNQFGNHVPKPPHWGGFLVQPDSFEFWQGRPNRLHDRLFYTYCETDEWKIVRLAP